MLREGEVAYIAVELPMVIIIKRPLYASDEWRFLRGMFPIEGGGAYMASTWDVSASFDKY